MKSELLPQEKWEIVSLGSICNITSSKRIFAKEYQSSGIPFYRGKEIIEKHNGNSVSTELFISPERFREIQKKFGTPQIGDILLTSVGTLGVSWLVDETDFYFKDGNLTWLRCNDRVLNKYLYLWLNSPEAQYQIDTKCIGSTQKALTIETLNKFQISLPSLSVQEKICSIIYPILDKIELNRKINENLEWQARAIFEDWCGQCQEKVQVGNLVNNILDYTPNPHPQVVLINSSEVTKGHFEHHNLYENTNLKGHFKKRFKKYDILYSEIRPKNRHYAYVMFDADKYIASTRLMVIRAKKEMITPSLLYQHLSSQRVCDEFASTTETRSGTFPQGCYADFSKIELPYMPLAQQMEITIFLDNVYSIIQHNDTENERLATLRNALLPKLISGEIIL